MADAPDYYTVLGVSRSADRAMIHAAWKALLRQYHPDANHGVDVSARAKEINEAYAVLGKEDARAAYDRARATPPPQSPPTRRAASAMHPGRGAMRPGPFPRPDNSFSQPPSSNQWLVGLLLLILTTAPLGMILVLYYEESHSIHTGYRDGTGPLESQTRAVPDRFPPNATLRPR